MIDEIERKEIEADFARRGMTVLWDGPDSYKLLLPTARFLRREDLYGVEGTSTRTDDTLASWIAWPIWALVWHWTFKRVGRPMWEY